MPHDFIIVRRAHYDKEKRYITKASRPIICKNCHAGMNRSASAICAYLMTKKNPYTYERAVELLKKANSKRNLDVLTNSDFRRALRFFPIYEGTAKNVSPQMLSKYKRYLRMYE